MNKYVILGLALLVPTLVTGLLVWCMEDRSRAWDALKWHAKYMGVLVGIGVVALGFALATRS